MALENRLDLRLSQRLILTPQLQQAIKLLQMPQLELAQALNQELIENPFLEEVFEEYESERMPAEERTEYEASFTDDNAEMPFGEFDSFTVEEYFDERSSDGRDLGYFNAGMEEQPSYELFYSKQPDIYDHLIWQLRLCDSDDEIRKVAEAVIGNIDDDGYLRATDEELAHSIGVDASVVSSAVDLVQGFDPAGVAARDLRECLLLQTGRLEIKGSLVEKIISNNMDDLQKRKYSVIAKQHEAELSDVMDAVKIIERLDPRPGSGFSAAEVSYVVPDVFITRAEDEFQIRLNDEHIPRLCINRRLILTNEEREYLRGLVTSAYTDEQIAAMADTNVVKRVLKRLSADKVSLVFSIKQDERELLKKLMPEGHEHSSDELGMLPEKLGSSPDLNQDEKGFLKDKFRVANELIEGINQRSKTIYKVSESILKFQRDFFEKGKQCVKPLNLKDVAADIGMHESTISRVTSNKYLACDHGVFGFRFFFSSAIQSEDGEVSSTLVKDLIRKMISEENQSKPLSDQMLADGLKAQNINIARRTIAKYREELKIPSQSQRKRFS
ncbi:MAG: RNA polymerase sigma-54 factor [Nitrospiraceae bacterium]|nr:RNA polymerase sigma-54 factor [Nitrospiraceae bacterium]